MNVRKIIVIKNDKIGDMIISTCVFRELKEEYPNSKITVLCSKSNKPIIEKNKFIDNIDVLDYPPKNFKDYLAYLKFSRKIKNENFDLGIDLRGGLFNILLLFFGRVKYKIGFYNRFFSKIFLDYGYRKNRINRHVTFQRLDLLNKALGINRKNSWPEVATDKEDFKETLKFLKENKIKDFVCVIPDSSVKERQWDMVKWDEIVKHLHTKYKKYKIVVLGSDMDKMGYLSEKNNYVITPKEMLNLRTVYLLLKRSKLVICQDGGAMHLAWAGKSNLIALISGYVNRPEHFNKLNYVGPLGKKSSVIYKDMNDISADEVKWRINSLIL